MRNKYRSIRLITSAPCRTFFLQADRWIRERAGTINMRR